MPQNSHFKYSSVDNSPLSRYVMHPFWDRTVQVFPKWLAPNLMTFAGFMCLIVQWALFSFYDFHFYGYCFERDACAPDSNLTARQAHFRAHQAEFDYRVPPDVCSCIPGWLWLVLALTQFLSHHLDGMDGKQARRTGSSSPLGELFDHGLDSWATLFLPVALFSVFGRADPYGISIAEMYAFLWVILLSFIISHWEKYNTGVLFLPWSYDLSQTVGRTAQQVSKTPRSLQQSIRFQGNDNPVLHDLFVWTERLVLYNLR